MADRYLPIKISLLHSTTSHFQDTRLSKIGSAPNDLRMALFLDKILEPKNCQSVNPTHSLIHSLTSYALMTDYILSS